jgi:threonine dehydrogenase-like Zn-dependent dehydrogenase
MVSFTVFKGSKEGKIVKSTSTREIRPDEVLVRITHSGLCGTDEHFKYKDMVLGHEGAGVVEVSSLSPSPTFQTLTTNFRKSGPMSRAS